MCCLLHTLIFLTILHGFLDDFWTILSCNGLIIHKTLYPRTKECLMTPHHVLTRGRGRRYGPLKVGVSDSEHTHTVERERNFFFPNFHWFWGQIFFLALLMNHYNKSIISRRVSFWNFVDIFIDFFYNFALFHVNFFHFSRFLFAFVFVLVGWENWYS